MDKDTLTLIGNIAICLSSSIILIDFGLIGRSLLQTGYALTVRGVIILIVFGLAGHSLLQTGYGLTVREAMIFLTVLGLVSRSILRSKGYSGLLGFAFGAVFGILGLIIAFVLPKKTPQFSSQVLPSSPIRTTSSSYAHNNSNDSSDRDDYLRGMQQLLKEESREAEERERRENEEAARERYEERERDRQEEWNDYYAQKEQERIDRLYEERDERLRSKYGWSDDE